MARLGALAAGGASRCAWAPRTCRQWLLPSGRGNGMNDVFLPDIAWLADVCDETPDTRTFRLRFRDLKKGENFHFLPGQFLELSVFGSGEAPFCIASSPTRPGVLETTVRRTGQLTDQLHRLGNGDEVGIRGPFGNGFDVQAARGKDMLFVAGGIGLPPLRSLIWNVLDERDRFGKVTIHGRA